MIPKPGGGERPLGIPTIRDRVAQTAAKLMLEPIFEADFEPNALTIGEDARSVLSWIRSAFRLRTGSIPAEEKRAGCDSGSG
jgi:RNA-directed DNA polymerase